MGTEIDGVIRQKEAWNVVTWPNGVTFLRLIVGILATLHIINVIDMFALQPLHFLIRSGIGGDIFVQWSTDYRILIGGIILTLAIASDVIDGWLARTYDWKSHFGEVFDPLADKILFWAGYVAIVVVQQIMTIPMFILCTSPLFLILIYDVWSVRKHIRSRGGAVSSGKTKSCLLNIALLACFISIVLCNLWPEYKDNFVAFHGGFIVALVFIIFSIPMFYNSWRMRH